MIDLFVSYLNKSNYRSRIEDFREYYQSHPNYPSLYAITDSLSLLEVENIAAQIPKDQFDALPDKFIAQVQNDAMKEFALIHKQEGAVALEFEKGQTEKLSVERFLAEWTGLIVAIEPNQNKNKEISELSKSSKYYVIGAIALLLTMSSFFYEDYRSSYFIFKVISFIGLIFSIYILKEKYSDQSSGLIAKICGANSSSKSNCNVVIDSESKFFGIINYTDLPLVFFVTNFIVLSFNSAYIPIINFFSLCSIPVILHSFYLQWFKIKSKCTLCLTIAGLVLLQPIIYYASGENIFNFKLVFAFQYLTFMAAMFLIWTSVDHHLQQDKANRIENRKLRRFKRNFELFQHSLKKIENAFLIESFHPLVIGNKNAPIALKLFLSPSCGHCHTAYSDGLELIQKYPEKVNLQIMYNLNPDNQDNPYIKLAKITLSLGWEDKKLAEQALYDWHIQRLDLEAWHEKWSNYEIDEKASGMLNKQYEWCRGNDFNFTPVKLIDDFKYPDNYELKDLMYFISDLEEEQNKRIQNDTIPVMENI